MSSLEDLFGKLAMTTVTTVSRIALSHATNAAIRNVTSYVTTQLPKNKPDTREIRTLQRQLDLKIKNLKPTIDIIARSVADGNQDLESALEMCNDLKQDIDDFSSQVQTMTNPDQVKSHLKRLLSNVDDAIPSLHLSLRSIENRSGTTTLPASKLVQASHILAHPTDKKFKVKLYSLFSANQREPSAKAFTWKEEFPKSDLVLMKDKKMGYALKITEDINDGLYHEEGESKKQMVIDLSHIQRMYYTQSGELLNIEDAKDPVLVMKVSKEDKKKSDNESVHSSDDKLIQVKETAPEIVKEELQESQWYAVGLWTEQEDSTDDDDDDEEEKKEKVRKSPEPDFPLNLLLLESVIKLALLEISEQMNHLQASDELITLYMK